MSVQDENWFQELGIAAAHNSSPNRKRGEMWSFALSPRQVVALSAEIDRLNKIESDNWPCKVCEHPYSAHPFDGVIQSQFCMYCSGKDDLHNFELA